jgi:signal transduction histidine kinase
MADVSPRLVPRRWRHLPARSARLRLTLMYSGLSLMLGTAAIVIIFALVTVSSSVGAASVSQAVPGQHQTIVHVAASQQRSADVARLLAVSLLVWAFTAVISGPIGWFAAGRVLRPLREMTATARTISAGNLHERLALGGPHDEFKRLGDTFDDLLARLDAAFAAQRRFVANAAHELRTPLTLERTLLQVALADSNASAARLRATCEELLDSGRQHEQLLDALLTLATSERGLDRHEQVDLAPLAERSLRSVDGEIRRRQLEQSVELASAPITGDPALVARLVANLIDNAVRHNRTGGRIEIRTLNGSVGSLLSVANTGPTIPPEAIERLFEPFQRLGEDRIESDGHGLGLSIARAIATAHGAAIRAEPRPDGGLAVTVSFPGADAVTVSRTPPRPAGPPATDD